MAICREPQYPWGGLRCTLPAGHGGDDHVAEGRINYTTGRAPVLGTWPVMSAVAVSTDAVRQIKWKRVRPGQYHGAVDRIVRYVMTKSNARWFIATPDGVVVGSAGSVDDGKGVGERHLREAAA